MTDVGEERSLEPLEPREVRDKELESLAARGPLHPISARGGGDDWDAPFDLRVARPRAVDLRALWAATGEKEPPDIAAALGPNRPILLTHVVTPFPKDGRSPARVWALGYELVAHDANANTVSVVPSTEEYKAGELGQSVEVGIDLGGRVGSSEVVPGIDASIRAVTNQKFQFNASIRISLRKVMGAPVGTGGAVWKMFRQNEPLDQPHTLLQTVLVGPKTRTLRCTLKTWATQAGFLGTSLGARFWPYEDQEFEVALRTG